MIPQFAQNTCTPQVRALNSQVCTLVLSVLQVSDVVELSLLMYESTSFFGTSHFLNHASYLTLTLVELT